MGIEVCWSDDEVLLGRAMVDIGLLGRDGGQPGVGSLVPIVDLVAGSRAARSVEGDWLATADVWLFERNPIDGKLIAATATESGRRRSSGAAPIELSTRLLRAGKRSTVVAVEVEAGSFPVASCTIEFSRIRRDATALDTRPPGQPGQWSRLGSGPLLDRSLESACGFRVVDEAIGAVELHRGQFVNNSIGTLQGGVIALLADVSAATLIGPGARTIDLHFRFLDQTGRGPALATAEIVRTDSDGHMVKVEVVDTSTDRLVGWANCRVLNPT